MRYPKEQVERAKKDGLHLVTLEILGRHARKGSVTYQGFLFTDEQVQKAWDFFQYLVTSEPHPETLPEGSSP
ncbi:MAG TPA: hypothetical protein VGE74_08595 [Gemmata sp.]